MTNFPQNENLNNEIPSAEIPAEEEFSTIFSDPTEHKKKAKENKTRKRWPIAVASLLAVAVLVSSTVAIIKLIPEKEDEVSSSTFEDIKVLDMKSDDLSSVTVKNKNGTYKLYSEVTTAEAKEGEKASETVTWYLDGYAKDVVSTYSVSSTASDAVSITASREITQKTAEECGLLAPVIKADIVTRKGESFSVLVGADSPDNSGCYVKLSNSDKIYLADTSVKTNLTFNELDFANTDALPAITLGADGSKYKTEQGLASFDSITVSGTNFSDKIVIEMNDHELLSTYAVYKITSPASRLANSDNIAKVFNIFANGVSVTGAYSYDVSAAALAKFGLDKPDFQVTMKAGSASQTFKFKLQADGNYAAVCNGSKLIKTVSASTLEFINFKETDFYWGFVALNSIDDLKGFVYTGPSGSYNFTIAANPDEDADDKYIITHNGKPIVCGIFQDFYQMCISLTACDYKTENVKGNAPFKFEFIFKDDKGGKSNVIEFVKSSETRYEYFYDGVAMGRVTSSDLNKIEKAISKVLNGEDI